jgi:hypothetical protein
MILSYISTNEGVGAQYQRILGILAVCKINGFKYYHNCVTVGHNYDNEPDWNKKWDDFFNIINSDLTIKENLNLKNIFVPHTISNINQLEKTDKFIYDFENAHYIINQNPELYYNSIINDIRKLYFEKNINRELKFFIPDKKNVAIHIRTANSVDTEPHELLPGQIRYISNNTYKKIIINLANENNHIHIFTQGSFPIKEIETGIKNISYHIDTDTFDTFHHFVNADILVISKSSFSYLAAIYNKNNIMYLPSHLIPLKHWINIDFV